MNEIMPGELGESLMPLCETNVEIILNRIQALEE